MGAEGRAIVLNWVEVDAGAICGNLAEFRERMDPGVRLGAVVKANAYGHGMLQVAGLMQDSGRADWLCVNSVGEAVELREAGSALPILVLGYIPLDELDAVVEHDLRPVVYNVPTVERLGQLAQRAGRRVRLHVKVETGTHRQGVTEEEVPRFAEKISTTPNLELEGISTHFANIEDTTDHGYAEQQLRRFTRIRETLAAAGLRVPVCHAACSAAALLFTRTHFDLVRIGISMYGLWSSQETRVSCLERGKAVPRLRPALTWKTRVAQVKQVDEGAYVGYGCAFRATRASRIAVLPLGYAEGYDRQLSGTAHVLIRGKRAPIRGRVCMNMCMADVTDIPDAGLEDEVVLLGRQGAECLPAEQLGAWCGTIAYEIVARIAASLPRVIVNA